MRHSNLQNYLQRFAFWRAVVFFVLIVVSSGCKKDALSGVEIQPEGSLDQVQSIDTFTVRAFTTKTEPQRSSQYRTFAGTLVNDQFGKASADLYLNFRLQSENIVPLDDPSSNKIDSVILTIYPSGVYGSSEPLPLEVYQLDEPLELDSLYASNASFRTDDEPLGETILQFESTSEIQTLLADSTYNGLRIKIKNELGSFLLNGLGIEYYNTEQFKDYFNGIVLKTKQGAMLNQGAIYDFAIAGGNAGLTVYYHSTEPDGEQRTLSFEMGDNTSRINGFEHDYSSSMVQSFLESEGGTDDLLYVQGMSGVKCEIQIPGISNFGQQTDAVINKATLTFEVSDMQPQGLEPAPRLYLLDYEKEPSSGDLIETLTLDYIFSSERNGGFFDEDNNTYTFDITREIQDIIEQEQAGKSTNFGFTLNAQVPVLNQNTITQTVLKGSNNIVFNVFYTDISK